MVKKIRVIAFLCLSLAVVFSLCACDSGQPLIIVSTDPQQSASPEASPTDIISAEPSPVLNYTVTYDGNGAAGGTVPVDANTYTEGASAAVLDNTGILAQDGYNFSGWNTAADGSGALYTAGMSVVVSADITLYAQWVTATPTPSPTATIHVDPVVTPEKTRISIGTQLNFEITTGEYVTQIQTIVDGVAQHRIWTEFTASAGTRKWKPFIFFTNSGNRKVQFKCTLDTGATELIPEKAIVITVPSPYAVTPTAERSINSGDTITYTLTTPSSITSVYAVVDGVKQTVITTPASDENLLKKWTVKIKFNKTGTRSVQFKACEDTSVKKTLPSTAITVIVN